MTLELKPHQANALKEMHNGCILRADPGSGKSITGLMYYYNHVCGGIPQGLKGASYREMTDPKNLYIFTTAKKRNELDWFDEASHFGLGRGLSHDGVMVHVDSWNNLSKYEDVKDSFIIFDEQRLVGSGAWVKTFLKLSKNNEWIILSATPGDTWLDYIPVFVANGFYKNRTEFIDKHVEYEPFAQFPKVKRFHGEATLDKLRNRILVEMPYERHTVRHVENTFVDYDKELYEMAVKQRWHPYEKRPLKNAGELESVLRRIINSDASRYGEVLKILEKHSKLIIFYNFNYELDMLRILANTLNYPVGEWNGHKHEAIPDDPEKWIYLVQYTAGAEAWNCIETNAITFWSLNYSWKIFEQSKGRIDRLNTPFKDLFYYVLRSMSPMDTKIWGSVKTKEKFNGKAYAEELWKSYVPF